MKPLAWTLALSTCTLLLVAPRTAEACSCSGATIYPNTVAPPDTLIFVTSIYWDLDGIVLEHQADDGATIAVETTPVAQSPGYLVAQPERLLDLGAWTVHSSTYSNISTFEVVEGDAPAPEVPIVTNREPFSADLGTCGRADFVRFHFQEPVAAIFAQIVDPDPSSTPAGFDIQGQTVHAFAPLYTEGEHTLTVGSHSCGTDLPVAGGTSLRLRFAAMTADGRMSEWTGPKQAEVPSGCSITSVGPSPGPASWAAVVTVAGLGLLRRRRAVT